MAIEWNHIGQPAFDRHVEALLYRLFDSKTITVDGRGGDGGIDVSVITDAGLRIFQLKYHPDGFPGSYRGRRTAIKKSFHKAMRHQPVEWTLVVPCTLSPSDRAFVDKLSIGMPVKVSVMDRTALDSGFAAHADLDAFFTRDQAREAARDFQREEVLLVDDEDLDQRVRALGTRADNVDSDWTWDFQRQGNTVIRTLRGKHALAHETSPVQIHVIGRPEAMTPQLTAALDRALGYGIAEEVDLPPEAVARLTVDGPPSLTKTVTDVRVTWKPEPSTAHVGTPVALAFLGTDGSPAARYVGQLVTVGKGGLGASIDADIHGTRLQILLPFNSQLTATLRYTYDLDGKEPAEAMKILRLQQRLLRGGPLQLTVNGAQAGTGTLPATADIDVESTLDNLLLYLSDLDIVQRHCETYFPAPLTYTGEERIDLRVARLLVEGRCLASPDAGTITVTLSGSESPALHTLLSGQPQCLRIATPGFEITVGGHTLDIGPVNLFHTRVTADNGLEAIAALRDGRGAGIEVVFRPHDGEHFRVYLASGPDDQPLMPTPLGLPGYIDPS